MPALIYRIAQLEKSEKELKIQRKILFEKVSIFNLLLHHEIRNVNQSLLLSNELLKRYSKRERDSIGRPISKLANKFDFSIWRLAQLTESLKLLNYAEKSEHLPFEKISFEKIFNKLLPEFIYYFKDANHLNQIRLDLMFREEGENIYFYTNYELLYNILWHLFYYIFRYNSSKELCLSIRRIPMCENVRFREYDGIVIEVTSELNVPSPYVSPPNTDFFDIGIAVQTNCNKVVAEKLTEMNQGILLFEVLPPNSNGIRIYLLLKKSYLAR